MSTKRIERLLNILIALLSKPNGLSKQQLQDILVREEKSELAFGRTFERDKVVLKNIGILLLLEISDNVFPGDRSKIKYCIDKQSYLFKSIDFDQEEFSIILAASRVWQQTALQTYANRATTKLKSYNLAKNMEYFLGFEMRLSTQEFTFNTIINAILKKISIRFLYDSHNCGETKVTYVAPWGIGQYNGIWYLVAYDQTYKSLKTFRLSRIVSNIKETQKTYQISKNFNIKNELSHINSKGSKQQAILVLSYNKAQALRKRAIMQDNTKVIIDFFDVNIFAKEIASYGPDVVVVSPKILKKAVLKIHRIVSEKKLPKQCYETNNFVPQTTEKFSQTIVEHLCRLLALVPYLYNNQGVSVQEAAKHFSVQESVLLQDLKIIFLCGLPGYGPEHLIDIVWDTGFIYINNGEELNKAIRLVNIEAATLLFGLEVLDNFATVAEKIVIKRIVKKIVSKNKNLENFGQQFTFKVANELLQKNLHILRQALDKKKHVYFEYLGIQKDEVSYRLVDPFLVKSKDNLFYLHAWCHKVEQKRLFRVDRIFGILLKDLQCFVENPIMLEKKVLENKIFVPKVKDKLVTLALLPEVLWVANWYVCEEKKFQSPYTIIRIKVSNTSWLKRLVVSCAGALQIVFPEKLALESKRWSLETLKKY